MDAPVLDRLDDALPASRVSRSPSIAALAAALAKAQGEITGADKSQINPHYRSKYADLASVWEACRAALSKHGLAVLQSASADGATVTVTTVLMHGSGEWMEGALTMTAQQNTPQGIGSACTYARRYALSAMVGVAPEDDDGNAASHRTPPLVIETPKDRPAAPEGCVYIERIDHEERTLKNGSLFKFANVVFDSGALAMATGEQLVALLEQVAQEHTPLKVTIEKTAKGFDKITKAVRWKPPVAAEKVEPLPVDQVPF